MHESLTEAFKLGKSRLTCGHFRKVRIHARVPATEAFYTVTGVEVLYVVALTRRADEGTRSATETRLRKLLPFGSAEEFLRFARAEAVRRKARERELCKAFLCDLFLLFDGFSVRFLRERIEP